MNVMVLQVFVSLMLVAGSLLLFVYTVKSRTFEHAERLSLAPLEEDLRAEVSRTEAAAPAVASSTHPGEQ
jgi:nitrogen fixation-related uncharacterized protein